MTFLPIVERELRVLSRRVTTHGVRLVLAALATVLVAGVTVAFSSKVPPARLAMNLFSMLSFGLMGLALISGLVLTADALSHERREGTLGLLFLTDLGGLDIVLGKMSTHSLQAVFGFLAAFPVLAIPMLYGGVSGGQFLQVVIALLSALSFSLSLGLLVSASGTEIRSIQGIFLFVLLLVCFGVFGVSAILSGIGISAGEIEALSPFQVLAAAHLPWVGMSFLPTRQFVLGVCFQILFCVFAIAIASRRIRRHWMYEGETTQGLFGSVKRHFAQRRDQRAERRRARTAGLLPAHPFQWLMLRHAELNWWSRLILEIAGVTVVLLLAVGVTRLRSEHIPLAMLTTFGMHVLFKGLVLMTTLRRLHEELRAEPRELLLVTPLARLDLLRELSSAFWFQWRRPAMLLVVPNVLIALVVGVVPGIFSNDRLCMLTPCLLGIPMLWIDMLLIPRIAAWMVFRTTALRAATLGGIALLLFPGWACLALCFLWLFFSVLTTTGVVFIELTWFAIVLGVSVTLMRLSDQRSRFYLRRILGNEGSTHAAGPASGVMGKFEPNAP